MRENFAMTEGTKAHNCAYYAVLCSYLASERGRGVSDRVRMQLERLPLTPLRLEQPTEDLVHGLREQLEAAATERAASSFVRSARACVGALRSTSSVKFHDVVWFFVHTA